MKKIIILLLSIAVGICLVGCCFSHEWVDATCTTPKTCSKCGKTEGAVSSHTWNAATCTTLKTCSICAATEGEYLPHNWLDATCTKSKTCSICGVAEGDTLPHTWVDATCTVPKTCSNCSTTEGEAPGHTANEWSMTQAPTCTEEGIKSSSCVVCGEPMEQNVAMLEHSVGDWVVTKQATSSEKGERTKSCTVCNTVIETEEFERSPEEIEAEYKASCKTYTYKEIARNPGEYEGKLAVFTGEVIQAQQEELYGLMFYVLRVDVTKSGRYYTDTMYVTYWTTADAPRILEDDIIVMYGELTGEKTYTTVMGASVTIPSFSAEYIEIK